MRTTRTVRIVITMWLAASATLFWGTSPSSAASAPSGNAHQLIQGSGSSWAANAVTQWIADVNKNGLQVVFSSTGSAQGRIDFASNTADFAVSDIGFLGKDPVTGVSDTNNGRPYAYLPIVAGGTALPYHIVKNGQLVRNLRLSPDTIAKIFTQQITNWDDPQITKDNNGNAMPNLQIIPVQHSEGSGSSYQFTRFMSKVDPSVWKSVPDEYFPQASGAAVAENGSDGVMNFLTSGSANGAIAYDEYSYALGKNYPVVKVLNKAGYYTLPTQYNVAVALTKAIIDPQTLLQTLDNVYTDSDPRTYPISSYSYAIIPTGASDTHMNTAKRQTLADYLQYSVCQGQAEMGRIGYSPLPFNLVQGSFARIKQLHSADAGVDVSSEQPQSCNNPTFDSQNLSKNLLAEIAPQPASCDKQGTGPCTGAGNTGQANPIGRTVPTSGGGTTSGGGSTSGGGTSSGGTRASTGGAGATGGGTAVGGTTGGTGQSAVSGGAVSAGSTAAASGGTHYDPNTGGYVANTSSGTGSGSDQQPVGSSTVLADSQSGSTDLTLALLAGGLVLGALIAPAVVAGRLSRRGPS